MAHTSISTVRIYYDLKELIDFLNQLQLTIGNRIRNLTYNRKVPEPTPPKLEPKKTWSLFLFFSLSGPTQRTHSI